MEKKSPQATTPYDRHPKFNIGKTITERLKLCFLILCIYIILNFLHIGCPFKGFLGISCPGCGMTRAVISVLQLHFSDAFYYHPLFLLTPIMFLLFLFDSFLPGKYKNIAWAMIITLFLITYFYRLLWTQNPVVSIDIKSGLIFRLLHKLIA